MIQMILQNTEMVEPQEYGSHQTACRSEKGTCRKSKKFGINGLAIIFLVVYGAFVGCASIFAQCLLYDYHLSMWRGKRRIEMGYNYPPDRVIFEPSVLVYSESVTVSLYEDYPKSLPRYVDYKVSSITKPITTDEDDIRLLTLLAQAEAGNQGPEGIRRVVDVVLNRVESQKFPNTIKDVIFQPGQFDTASNLSSSLSKTKPVTNVKDLVCMELNGDRLDKQSLYFGRSPITHKGLYQFGDHFFSY